MAVAVEDIAVQTQPIHAEPGPVVHLVRPRVEVWRVRSTIGAAHRDALHESLRLLGLGTRRSRHTIVTLTPQNAGAIHHTAQLLKTAVVVADGVSVALSPYKILRLLRERRRAVRVFEYDITGRPSIALEWSAQDQARVERYDGFTLAAWSCRLTPRDAVRYLLGHADPDAHISAQTLSDTYDDVTREVIGQLLARPEAIRLLRVENASETLVWQTRWTGDRLPAQIRPTRGGFLAGDTSIPELAVMSPAVEPETVDVMLRETATVPIALDADTFAKAL